MIKALIRAATLSFALLVGGCGDGGSEPGAPLAAPTPAIPAPNGGEWTRVVVETPEGGFRMGNPVAPVKLVEYASVTCSHCATFSKQATGPITQLVKSGHLSWEFRHYLIFPTDPSVSLLARCQRPGAFFSVTEQLYAIQSDWLDKFEGLSSSELERINALPPQQRAAAKIEAAGLGAMAREPRERRCLADDRQFETLVALTRLARSGGVRGTPTFLINGKIVPDAGNWNALRPHLESALRH